MVLVNLAAWCGRMAVQAMTARRAEEMVRYLDRGDALVAQLPPGADPANEPARRSTEAYLLGLRGELFALVGRRPEALQLLRRALELSPDSTLAGRWKAYVDRLAIGLD